MADRAQIKAPAPARGGAAAAAIAAVALMVTPFTGFREGLLLTPKRDMGGVLTWCHGETRGKPQTRYTAAQCDAMIAATIRTDFAPAMLACVPTLAENRFAFAAMVDVAYNAGKGAACRSPAAARMRLRNWRRGCQAIIGWRATVHGQPVRGLANRRRDEAALCMRGVA